MGKQSQINGREFEIKMCNYLFKKGYYVIYMEKGVTGSQPCDIVAIKDNIAILLECKNLENKNGIFTLDRVEQNQRLSSKRFKECGNYGFYLAIQWKNAVYMVNFELLKHFDGSLDLKKFEPDWRWGDEDLY